MVKNDCMNMRYVVEQVGVICTVAAVGLVKIEEDTKEERLENPEKNVIFHFFSLIGKEER